MDEVNRVVKFVCHRKGSDYKPLWTQFHGYNNLTTKFTSGIRHIQPVNRPLLSIGWYLQTTFRRLFTDGFLLTSFHPPTTLQRLLSADCFSPTGHRQMSHWDQRCLLDFTIFAALYGSFYKLLKLILCLDHGQLQLKRTEMVPEILSVKFRLAAFTNGPYDESAKRVSRPLSVPCRRLISVYQAAVSLISCVCLWENFDQRASIKDQRILQAVIARQTGNTDYIVLLWFCYDSGGFFYDSGITLLCMKSAGKRNELRDWWSGTRSNWTLIAWWLG